MNDNRIVGPGYYPRKPSPRFEVTETEGMRWHGWGTPRTASLAPSLAPAANGWKSGEFLYVYAADDAQATACYVRLFPGSHPYPNACEPGRIKKLLAARDHCVLAWPETGRWARFDHGVLHPTEFGSLP